MAAAIPDAFFLDDPQDGVSVHALGEIGVVLHRAAASGTPAAADLAAPADEPAVGGHLAGLLAVEHYLAVPSRLAAEGGALLLDVRDQADAWVRIVLRAGDAVDLAPKTNCRVLRSGCVVPAAALDFGPHPDRHSKQSTVVFAPRAAEVAAFGAPRLSLSGGSTVTAAYAPRFTPGSAEEAAASVPHFERPGTPHTRALVAELCESFYHLGWVTGTGGSISIRHGARTFMAPSGVQKERMQPQDIYVLDSAGKALYAPAPLPGKRALSLSQCAPLFHHAFSLRGAGACIHTHDAAAVLATLQSGPEWRVTHQEMIKGIAGHGFESQCVVPVIENTPHECDLADSLAEAMTRYPAANAVLVRRHGVYVWGASWEAAKTQAECYHYLFDMSVRMRGIGLDPGATPTRVAGGIGAATSYGTALAGRGGGGGGGVTPAAAAAAPAAAGCSSACCGAGGHAAHATPPDVVAAAAAGGGDGFHGASGTNALLLATAAAPAAPAPLPLNWARTRAVLLDIEGATTPLSFVTRVLFPFAAEHSRGHVLQAWGSAELGEDVAALAQLSAADRAAGVLGATQAAVSEAHAAAVLDAAAPEAARAAVADAVAANVAWQMGSDRKSGPLKQLQGHVWRRGYADGRLQGQVFSDVPGALAAWAAAGRKSYIYSSGSREAQRLLFGSVAGAGDLRPLLSGFFDTTAGAKTEAASYRGIALALGVDGPGCVLFATDSLAEARAAAAAGMQAVLTLRPGNVPLPAGHGFPTVASLAELGGGGPEA